MSDKLKQGVVEVLYENWRGEVAVRRIIPHRLHWGETSFHPEPQWLLDCWDVDKDAVRTYAMAGIKSWGR